MRPCTSFSTSFSLSALCLLQPGCVLVPWLLWAGDQKRLLAGLTCLGPGLRGKRRGEGFEGSRDGVNARGWGSERMDEDFFSTMFVQNMNGEKSRKLSRKYRLTQLQVPTTDLLL